ncbi:hypothetical protein FQZ97_1069000 [compost metagenome]
MPSPCLVSVPLPVIAPDNVSVKLPVSITGSVVPVSSMAFATFKSPTENPNVVPSSIAKGPLPNAVLWPTMI